MTRLRQLRIDEGYSLRQLAARLDLSHQAISFWERGRCWPTPQHAKRLRDHFGLPIEEILAPVNEKE